MARSAKEIVQNATDKQGAKNVNGSADRDSLLNNIDKITHLQEIYKKIDNLETLTDEERKDWQSLSKEDKMHVIDAYNGVNMNMRESPTFADLDTHSKDYSDLAPETEPKDTEREKVFNPSEADESDASTYDKLVTAVANLKAHGKSTPEIKALLKAAPDYKAGNKIDVPEWSNNEITGSKLVDIDSVINDLAGKELTPEEIERSKKLTKVSKYKQTRLHNKRMAAVPENQKRSAEEQSRITEGYKDEVHPDVSEGGRDALYADLDKAKDAGFIKKVENNVNLLAGKDNDTDFANKVLAELLRSKNADKDFSHSLSQDTLVELAKRFPNTKTKEGKTVNNIKPILDSLKETYDHDTFGLLKAKLNMVHSQGNTAANRLAREVERVNEANDVETGSREATARSVKPGSIMRREGVTALDKAFAGGTEADAAKKALAQDVNAYDEAFSGDPELAKAVRQSVAEAQAAKHSVDDWFKYFDEHPDVRFHNQANARTVNNTGLGLTAIYKDGSGKEVMEKLPLFGEDVLNFRDALDQYKQRTGNRPEVKTEFTNLNTKNTDATEDAPRIHKWVDRFDRFFNSASGDMNAFSTVFGDSSISKNYTRDENGFVTEYDKDPKKASGSNLRNSDYFNQLAGIMKDPKNSVPNLVELITAQHGKDAATKAKNLYNDVTELNSVFGPVLSGDSIDPSTLRSFAGKFNRLRRDNPNMSLTDIFNKGDVSDVFGIKVHPKFTGNDKFSRLDLLKAALKLAKYKKDVAKEGLPFDELRAFLDEQIPRYSNVVDHPETLPEGMDLEHAKDVLKRIQEDRDFIGTPAEREAKLRGLFVDAPDKDSLKSLADEAPEEYEKAVADYKDAMSEYALAKDQGSDFDVLNMLRKDVEEKRSKADYLKNTKVDILKRAEESGKPYEEVLNDYLHPDWDEDDMELNIKKMLAEYDLMDTMKDTLGGNPHNSNVLANRIGEDFDVAATQDPSFEGWRDKVTNWSRPVAVSQLMSSPTTAGMIGVTPEEWSAYSTNKGFFDSDTEQKRRNTTLTGQRKSAKGIAGADTLALNKFAQQLQDMDYTNDTAGKQRLHDELHAENDKLKDPYTRDKNVEERLANAIKGILADRPEEN